MIFEYWGGTVEEVFAYIFGIYKKFGGNNPSILAPTDSVRLMFSKLQGHAKVQATEICEMRMRKLTKIFDLLGKAEL